VSVRLSLLGLVFSAVAAVVMTAVVLSSQGASGVMPLALVVVVVGLVQAVVLYRLVNRPLSELRRMTRALGAGDLETRVTMEDNDEFGELGRVLNDMAEEQNRRVHFTRTEEERLRTVLDGMVEAVFVTDAGGEVVLANRAFRELVGGDGGDVVGKKAVEVIEDGDLRNAIWAGLRGETTKVSVDTVIGHEEHSLAAQVSPLPEEEGLVVVLHDVTELKRVDRIRRDFVANASHELRTPLTAILGFSETLKEGALDNREMAGRFVEKIYNHSLRLQRLADDLIALSRAETPSELLEREALPLNEVFHDLVEGFEAQAQAKNITLVEDFPAEPIEVTTNLWALEHVLVNLVDNAIKYTQAGGTVTARCRRGGKGVICEVSDTGAGIPKEHQARIFERFYRIDGGRSRDNGGTGLGLAIVKHLTHRMGGDIRVESEPGKGTTFVLTLP